MNNNPQEILEEEEAGDDLLFVTDVSHFAALVMHWHQHQMEVVKHFLTVPEGQVVEIEDEPPFTLSGDAHRGFILGIQLAINYLATLPFDPPVEQPPEVQH